MAKGYRHSQRFHVWQFTANDAAKANAAVLAESTIMFPANAILFIFRSRESSV